jgi:hypothetical protein
MLGGLALLKHMKDYIHYAVYLLMGAVILRILIHLVFYVRGKDDQHLIFYNETLLVRLIALLLLALLIIKL